MRISRGLIISVATAITIGGGIGYLGYTNDDESLYPAKDVGRHRVNQERQHTIT